MGRASQAASYSSSLQSWGSKSRSQSVWIEDVDVSGGSSGRYRVMDEDQQKREAEEVGRMIDDLKAQRLERQSSSRTRRPSMNHGVSVHPIRSSSPHMSYKSKRTKSERQSTEGRPFMDVPDSGDQFLPEEQDPVGDVVSQSFKEQVLRELQKMKATQRLEFEALERLQREKHEAERKARHLELELQEQRRKLSLNEEQLTRTFVAAGNVEKQREIILHEDSGSGSADDFGTNDDGDMGTNNEGEVEEDPELIDWDDVANSPPPYCDAASPAASPYKRSSGWPAWTENENVPEYSASAPQECTSPEPAKSFSQRSRSRSGLETRSISSQSSSSSRTRPSNYSRSQSPLISRRGRSNQDLRQSCAFFEEKAQAQAEAEQLAKDAARRLERACQAVPPQNLLEREAAAKVRKSQQLKELKREMRVEMSRERQVKARDVPLQTYLSATEADEAEQNRKERILKRSQKTLQEAALPPRMEVASKNGGTFEGGNGTSKTSVKQKKKLRIAAEEAERWRKHRPKPVPNFDHLHAQLEASAKKRKEFVRRGQVEEDDDAGTTSKDKGSEFFVSRAAELADLRERKEARKQRLLAKQEAIRQKKKQAQDKLIARTRASVGADVMPQRKPTKSETLRVQKLMADAAKKQQERDREEREADARERRREEATRRVRAQDLDTLAKDKAREQRQQFKEAIARNREKLLAAAALRPSLMERFTTTVKRETHHRAALEAVVKTVFEKDLSALKGILTDDEQELAVEMVAADNENNGNSADAD